MLRTLGMQPWFEGRMLVSHASRVFDEHGNLTDETTRGQLEAFMAGFTAFVGGAKR